MSEGESDSKDNLGIAFALVIGAGAATGLGAAVVFVPRLVKLASRKTLAGALGLSAGVMTYVSFVEIFGKATGAFEDAGYDPEKEAYIYGTLCFFAGVVFMVLLNKLVTWLLGGHHHHHHETMGSSKETQVIASGEETDGANNAQVPLPCCSDDPAKNLSDVKNMAEEIEEAGEEWGGKEAAAEESVEIDDVNVIAKRREDTDLPESIENESVEEKKEQKKLMQMSLNTALAIGIHNFPEGLATWVAALADPAVGAVLAIAIAIHNIPEGLCVAMPVYYATGQRWKAFGWAMLSGIAEPIAALVGYAILGAAGDFSQTVYGVLFGMVSGMMVIISMRELLPTAHRYDPEDSVVTYSFIAGMTIMALSLVLFTL